MNRIAERTLNIPPFIVMDVLERAHELERQGRDIIHLEIGEPDFPTTGVRLPGRQGSHFKR